MERRDHLLLAAQLLLQRRDHLVFVAQLRMERAGRRARSWP